MGATEGEFVVIEDFEAPHLFTVTGTLAKSFAERQTIHARQGVYGLGLRVWGEELEIGDYAQFERNFCLGRSPHLEVEVEVKLLFATENGQPNIDLEIQIPDLRDMTQRFACIRIDTKTKDVLVRTGATAYEKIGTCLDFADGDWLFTHFTINRGTSKYDKVLINEQEFDASAHSLYSTTTVDATKIYRLRTTLQVANVSTIVIDRLLIRTASM